MSNDTWEHPSAETSPDSESQRPYVLIVEDNLFVRNLLTRSLKNIYTVEAAATVDEALAMASQRRTSWSSTSTSATRATAWPCSMRYARIRRIGACRP